MIEWEIVGLSEEHLPQSVNIHLKAFPEFFLSSLGPSFLYQFYESFLYDTKGVGFVACQRNGKLLGVVVGPSDPKGYFKRLFMRRWWTFCISSIGAIVRKPSIAARVARAAFYRGAPPPGPARALLSSIAVSPEAQTIGVGKTLVYEWTEEIRRRGALGCYLTTDADYNSAVLNFYMKLGWQIQTSFTTPEKRRMHCLIYDFK
jgi:ribosomal protein S18 acetylase RimI-like enzyme